MVVKFPDGNCVNLAGMVPQLAATAKQITIALGSSLAAVYTYVCASETERLYFLGQIYMALGQGVGFLELYSTASLPTTGDAATTDMYVDDLNLAGIVSHPVASGQAFVTINAAGWPPAVAGGAGIPASFQPDGKLTIGTIPALYTTYINGVTLLFQYPNMVAGTYDLTYTDSRGTVTKAASIKFV